MPDGEIQALLAKANEDLRASALEVHELFLGLGCHSYVKTIYVGYEISGEMVAAVYPHADHLEIALALPEETAGEHLIDASHLTWRSLPVAFVYRTGGTTIDDLIGFAQTACDRVRSETHDVNRDNDFFIRSRRERRQRDEQT